MLEISHVFKLFGKQVVLNDITCTLNAGTISAVLGSSGSGKSTLLRCLARLEKTDGGMINFQGKNIAGLPACFIGMVFQGFHLFPHLTVLQNLVHAPLLLKRLSPVQAEEQANKWLAIFNLTEKAQEFSARLSGGQKQRVAIARTMMMEPSVILFDEPTSALDPEMVSEVASLIQGLRAPGRIIIMATHELRLAKLAADHILFIDQGTLIENSPKSNFFANPQAPRAQLFLKNMLAF